jgi:hypothetical protein|tara:strand:+ start:1290 stop:2162 length:873 start_codon:yes stop_codon:yes gene_type:complete
MRFDINKLMQAIEDWSMKMPAEDIQVTIPDNSQKERKHLGLSMLASECQRAVFYDFRKVASKEFPPRMLRLFQRGHREEFFFMHMLRGVGLTVYDVDPKTGKQFRVEDFEGHVSGSMDGVIRDRKKLFVDVDKPFKPEYKTYNAKRFNKLEKSGVREADFKYYGQMQGYLGYDKRLAGALFCAVCKDDDRLHFEWILPEPVTFEMLKERAEMILNATKPPPGISKRKSFWKCGYCDFKDNCFPDRKGHRVPSVKSCRSCVHATPGLKKSWDCNVGGVYGKLCEKWEDINR